MKDFLLLSNINAITYKDVFPLLKEGKARGGYNFNQVVMFETPEGETEKQGGISWYTTLPTTNKKKLILTKKYKHTEYPHYDNYNAIEVSKVKDIPYDYDCVMGVPITILQYDLDNVEVMKDAQLLRKKIVIMGLYCDSRADGYGLVNGTPTYVNEGHPKWQGPVVDGKAKYCRVLIRLIIRRKQL